MLADVVVCPQCGTTLQNSAPIAGQVVACPQCHTQLQMPALSQPAAVPQLPIANVLPPAIEQSLPARVGVEMGSASPARGPIVQVTRPRGEAAASVTDRLRKRSNPWTIVFTVVMVIVLIVVGSVAYVGQRVETAKSEFARRMVGNWELVPGQSQLDRWDFAFHSDGHLQMALGNQLSEGRWEVTSVRGATGNVLIEWPDDAPETMQVRLESSTMQIALDSVGNFAFRAAAP